MKRSTSWSTFIRRLSVFYIFLAIIAILFLVYYYYYVPANEGEFTERATRELKRVVDNFQKKSVDLDSTFSQAISLAKSDTQFIEQKGSYERLNENIPYKVDTSGRLKGPNPRIIDSGGWSILYPEQKGWNVLVSLKAFVAPLFEARNDIFDSYLLLSADSIQSMWSIIFKQTGITSSEYLRIDTLRALQKNSDLSAVIDLEISGGRWKLFFRPFDFHKQKLAVGGLIATDRYRAYIRNTPVKYIANCIFILVFIFVLLPFVKIFFLSPNEQINGKDVILTSLSIFLGTTAILIILFYIYVFTVSEQAFENRMKDISGKLRSDVETEFEKAGEQLNYYSKTYSQLPDSQRRILYYDTSNIKAKKIVDSTFCPLIYPNLTRVLWVDSAGNTLAKWNPLTFTTPLTRVTTYEFFRQLKEIESDDNPKNDLIIYPGKSNTTREYQFYIAKRDTQHVLTLVGDKPIFVRSIGILLAASLNCSTYPVLPPGFGFCIIDNQGNVLLHSDSRRNLSENILAETRGNKRLMGALNYRNSVMVRDAVLYGQRENLFITPVKDQPLAIVVFFDKKSVTANISRLLHFAITCLLYMFLAITICILCVSASSGDVHKIKFNLHKIEWIRPSAMNRYSYMFTTRFFKWLIVIYGIIFFSILGTRADARYIFYISLLLPVYAVLGFIVSRKHLANKYGRPKNYTVVFSWWDALARTVLDAVAVWVVLLLFNVVIYLAIIQSKEHDHAMTFMILLLAQFAFIAVLVYQYRKIVNELPVKRIDVANEMYCDDDPHGKIRSIYLSSLKLALILISVLPALGIFTYSFFCEKIQYKKKKELFVAEQYCSRYASLRAEQAGYKPSLVPYLSPSLDTLVLRRGIYLSDKDNINLTTARNKSGKLTVYDEPYCALADNLYQYTMNFFGEFTIRNSANDSDPSWQFSRQNRSLVLDYKNKTKEGRFVKISSAYDNPLYLLKENRASGIFFVLIVILFLYLEFQLINKTVGRLFMLKFFGNPARDEKYLDKFFTIVDKDASYCKGIKIPRPLDMRFFKIEEDRRVVFYDQKYLLKFWHLNNAKTIADKEQLILQMTNCFAPVYDKIWEAQSEQERYFLFNLSLDGYSNYKNSDVIFRLINKGILVPKNFTIKFFSLSFRNFILGKKGTQEIDDLKAKFSTGGVWQSIRTPFLVVVGGFVLFFVITQNELTHQLTALIASVAALGPLVVQLIGKGLSKKTTDSGSV
jgi:hypothetical protein